jgi:hypothetical protein
VAKEARLAEGPHEAPARAIDVMVVDEPRRDLAREARNRLREASVMRLEKRQAKKGLISHQSPSNTGFSFLTKAR